MPNQSQLLTNARREQRTRLVDIFQCLETMQKLEPLVRQIEAAYPNLSASWHSQCVWLYPTLSVRAFNSPEVLKALEFFEELFNAEWEKSYDDPQTKTRTFSMSSTVKDITIYFTLTAKLTDDALCQMVVVGSERKTRSKWLEVVEDVPIIQFVCPEGEV